VSIGLIEAASTLTRTSPGFGSGVGKLPTFMTSGVPVLSKYAAFIDASRVWFVVTGFSRSEPGPAEAGHYKPRGLNAHT
jgi:hypothetical protein